MFVTNPQYELEIPQPLAGPDGRYWGAVDLAVDMPWFLLTYAVDYGPMKLRHTSAVTCEPMLIELLALVPRHLRGGLALFSRQHEKHEPWRCQWVEALWSAEGDNESPGKLLVQLAGDSYLRTPSLEPVVTRHGHTLIYERPSPATYTQAQSPQSAV
jgi:hypothetical protein